VGPGGHSEKEARFPADLSQSPTTALAAIASKRGALADMDKAAIDVAKALARLSELTIFELRGEATARKLERASVDPLDRSAVKPAPLISLRPGTRFVRERRRVTHRSSSMPTVSSGAVSATALSPCRAGDHGRPLVGPAVLPASGRGSWTLTQARAMARVDHAQAAFTVRCALYTRKSSDEGLEQEFNFLDAQREACEAYS
jgi:hypothetical protein